VYPGCSRWQSRQPCGGIQDCRRTGGPRPPIRQAGGDAAGPEFANQLGGWQSARAGKYVGAVTCVTPDAGVASGSQPVGSTMLARLGCSAQPVRYLGGVQAG
jgi:hypothetical protein